ncbi:NmrA/HSCARG family protein [Actinobacteria bacterium YIM 96077]|uniref:NmrA/HSCARG family protein n=1 Tax=Phytoactinopolyspora halophila TaxID=1981511 RepID=A0A329QB07_9ACTN|nr:NmrA/HSCARG family protein [Phytoactinopolyspora halophila]AYY12628.1 NmrA/HSCARG family protein [Actinobacteria bacterium YIM 96077]RAW09513.1 NmrA/HSCARG family protein [Phytoactinopolyspora halophila]
MATDRTILVLGGTGRQGGAVARELLHRGWTVHALVRDPQKPAARALAAAGAVLVRGDLDDEASLHTAMRGAHGVFSVQTFLNPGGVAAEERQGKAVGDAAAQAGVAHLVYSSVGGAERSSGIPHFESKWNIEQHIQALGLPATILRPTMFHECFHDISPRLEKDHLVLGLWLRPEVPVQLIATADIGAFAADAFDDPAAWLDRQVEIAGDELTGPQMAAAFERVSGIPTRFEQQPIEQLRAVREDLASMFDWFDHAGYRADLPGLRRIRPDLIDLETWLRTNWSAPVLQP